MLVPVSPAGSFPPLRPGNGRVPQLRGPRRRPLELNMFSTSQPNFARRRNLVSNSMSTVALSFLQERTFVRCESASRTSATVLSGNQTPTNLGGLTRPGPSCAARREVQCSGHPYGSRASASNNQGCVRHPARELGGLADAPTARGPFAGEPHRKNRRSPSLPLLLNLG